MSIKELFSVGERVKPRSCEYNSIDECPYNSTKECKFDKTNCHLVKNKVKKQKSHNSWLPIVIVAMVGFIGYVVFTIASLDDSFAFTHSKYIYPVVTGIALSIVTGSILALVIDLPSRLKDYELSFVNALSSNNYLKSLDETRLTRLRNDITEQLHKTKAPCMAKGLIKIDQRICELLREPYYSRYRHIVICTNIENSNFIEKEHTIEYKLINPYGANQAAVEFLKFTNLVLMENGQPEKSMDNLKIFCRIDNKDEQNLSERIDFIYEDIENDFYNKKISLLDKDNTDGKKKGIRVEFEDSIEVKMMYKIKVHKNDPCFTKRLQHPAKNFRLDYTCNDDKIKLYGQIFGTEIKQSDVSIKYTSSSISLETFDWLLPDNGAIVVMQKK